MVKTMDGKWRNQSAVCLIHTHPATILMKSFFSANMHWIGLFKMVSGKDLRCSFQTPSAQGLTDFEMVSSISSMVKGASVEEQKLDVSKAHAEENIGNSAEIVDSPPLPVYMSIPVPFRNLLKYKQFLKDFNLCTSEWFAAWLYFWPQSNKIT